MTAADSLWTTCSSNLRMQVAEAVWQTTFNLVEPLELRDGILVLGVPNGFVKDRLDVLCVRR